MIRSWAIPVVIAVLSVSALGVAATTLETTLTDNPDDVIDIDSDRVPIGQSSSKTLLEQINSGGNEAGEPSDAGDGSAETTGSGEGDAGDGTTSSGNGDGSEGSADTDTGSNVGNGAGADTDGVTGDPRLPTLLATILQIPLVVALTALTYRYRRKFFLTLGLRSADAELKTSRVPDPDADAWSGSSPSNVVDQAWLTMIHRIEPERPETVTPTECVALARDRGVDVEAAMAIATAFERVHYGSAPVAAEADRAREGLRQIRKGDTQQTGE